MKKKLKALSSLSKMDNFQPLNQEQLSSITGGYVAIFKTDSPYQSGHVTNSGQATQTCTKSCG